MEELNRLASHPDGIRVRVSLKQHKDNLRICIPRGQLSPYLGAEACWIKIEAKGRVFYKRYGPSSDFDLPATSEAKARRSR